MKPSATFEKTGVPRGYGILHLGIERISRKDSNRQQNNHRTVSRTLWI